MMILIIDNMFTFLFCTHDIKISLFTLNSLCVFYQKLSKISKKNQKSVEILRSKIFNEFTLYYLL